MNLLRVSMFCTIILLNIGLTCLASAKDFLEEPEDVKVLFATEHRFKCTVSTNSTILRHSFSWVKDGVLIEDQDDIYEGRYFIFTSNIVSNDVSVLNIKAVKIEDEGYYHCSVVQLKTMKTFDSRRARLTVKSLPRPMFPVCLPADSVDVLVGTSIKLSCKSENVFPEVNLKWYQNSNAINDGVHTFKDDEYVILELILSVKKEENNDVFTCQQTSELVPRNISSCSVGPITVRYKPTIIIQHTDQILPGRDSILFCQTFANPPVTNYKWIFSPKLNRDQYFVDETGQLLTLTNPTFQQNGTTVTCLAENEVGENSSTIRLHIGKSNINEKASNADSSGIQKSSETIDLSLDVIIIIAAGVVIIIVLVVLVPIYHYCLCRNDNNIIVDSLGKEVTQPEVYYETREGVILRHTVQDRSLPRVPTTEVYGHWRHSTASQVPNDLESHSYTYIDTEND
ncbi:kin of IRRE-like protein 2 [Antedon mediterranea]|uniref:kin of IRRE-like protein 2 n=1 Tax=Antedon mediterranea TaxID=105859 RepID=UPI003AF58624